MKVKFIGNPRNPSDNRGFIIWAGERFDLNVPRDLPEGKAFAKLASNSHFQVVAGAEEPPEPAAEAIDTSPLDGMDRDQLMTMIEELGISFDKRIKDLDKIKTLIMEARANV
jgi:hypothetical protein